MGRLFMIGKKLENYRKSLSYLTFEKDLWKIDANGVSFKELNNTLKNLNGEAEQIEICNVYGQRYIGTYLDGNIKINIHGTPGNDLGSFMNGPQLFIYGNAQDCCGNTMNEGKIVVFGRAGDIIGYSMRGGKIFIRDNVGYRAGIHMKEYYDKKPYLVVGGTAQDFLGEYMAGGVLVVLGLTLKSRKKHLARFVGTGMHGGKMYIRGEVENVGKEVEIVDLEEDDWKLLYSLIDEYCDYFGFDTDNIRDGPFIKLIPVSYRPYGRLYAY
jgi:glutamate synthase domain-containing protein 3